MATYDYSCETCGTYEERSVPIAEGDNQTCTECSKPLTKLFSPPSILYVPRSFRPCFSDLFGTTSEKDFIKENPNLERINPSTFRSHKDIQESKLAKAEREAKDIEHALINQGVIKEPIAIKTDMGRTPFEKASFKGDD